MANPQQPELARSRRGGATPERPPTTKRTGRTATAVADGGVAPVPPGNRPGDEPEVVPDKPQIVPDAYKLRVRYDFAFEPLLVPFSVAVGVTPATAHVTVDVDALEIRFGLWVLRTPRENVADVEVTGPYSFLKVAGPPHVSFADRGVTFATNRQKGACIRFTEDVPALLPRGILSHPAATVTVTDPEALAEALSKG